VSRPLPPTILLLVVASAAIHVGWNALARSARGSEQFAWRVNVAGAGLLLPFLIARRFEQPFPLDGRLVALAALSALFEAFYFVLLQAAYRTGELSVVYPLSRAVAPLLLLGPARRVSGDAVSGVELLGIAVVVAGTACIASSARRPAADPGSGGQGSPPALPRTILLALLVGAATAAYQLVDRLAMQLAPAGAELDFLAVMQLLLAGWLTLWRLPRWGRERRERALPPPPVRDELRTALFAAIGIQAAYFLILLALREGNVALVSAARNVGVPLSLLAGGLVLRERIDRTRHAGALLIVGGLLLAVDWRG